LHADIARANLLRIIRKVRVRILHPLRTAPTALLWGGLSLSAIGDQLYAVALGWIGVGILGANAGYLTALQSLVLLLAVLGVGRWADRWDPRRAMIGADLVRATILLAIVSAWLIGGTPSATGLILAIVVLAIGQAVFQPALQTVLPGVVADTAMLPAANGLLDATDRSARLIGPGLVGVLAAVVPTVHFLTIDAASFFLSATALLWIGHLRPHTRFPRLTTPHEPIWHAILRGVRALQVHPILGYYLKATGFVNGAWYALFFFALPLAIAERGIHGPGIQGPGAGLGAYGLVISAYGSTNLAATLVFGSRIMPERPQFQMFGGSLITGAGMILMAPALLLPNAWQLPGLMAAAAISAFGGPMKDIPMAVLRQTRVPAQDLAAAMRAYMAATSTGSLLALLLVPTITAAAGVVPVIIAAGAIVFANGIIALVRFANWSEPAPAPAYGTGPG
jgi:MFS family permease